MLIKWLVSGASVLLLAGLIICSILVYLISTAEAKVDSMNSQVNSTVNPDVLVPETLSFKRPSYQSIVQIPLIAVLDDGSITLLKEDNYPVRIHI